MLDQTMTLPAAPETDTQRIARGLRQRDVALLHKLVEIYQDRLLRYLIYFLGRRDHVDDLIQETWLRVLERGSQYDARSRFDPWLFTIARNLAIDHVRRHKLFSLDSAVPGAPEAALPLQRVSDAPSPFELAARTQDARRLASSLQSLEPQCREALLLRFQEDLSLQEIAAMVDAPLTTISSRIYRGLETLRKQLEGAGHAS
jgi:RNA polymerase sigma-70 factor (ECF subfamily)